MNEHLRHPIFNGELRRAIKKLRKWRNEIQGYWHSGDSYATTFSDLGYSERLSLLEKKLENEKVYVLDLMSFGKALSGLPKTEGLAVGVIRAEATERYFQKNPSSRRWEIHGPEIGEDSHFMEGDVLERNTWQAIDFWLEQRNAQFDLIVCRAGGAVLELPDCKEAYFILIQRMYDRLVTGGTLFTDSQNEFGNYLAEWINVANVKGVPAQCKLKIRYPDDGPGVDTNDVLRIDKLPSSPRQLPLLDKNLSLPLRTFEW